MAVYRMDTRPSIYKVDITIYDLTCLEAADLMKMLDDYWDDLQKKENKGEVPICLSASLRT